MEETQVFQPLKKHKNMFQKQHKASHFFYRFFLYVQFNPPARVVFVTSFPVWKPLSLPMISSYLHKTCRNPGMPSNEAEIGTGIR